MRYHETDGNVTTQFVKWLDRFAYVQVIPPRRDLNGDLLSSGAVKFTQWPGLKVWGALDYLKAQGWRIVNDL